MKIVTLIENSVTGPDLVAEHGLSLYIETTEKKILFDTGQTGLIISNALKLNVDLSEIDIVILSHGHYDHTGGLYPFLEINQKAVVYAKKEVFEQKYSGKTRFIGTEYKPGVLDDRIRLIGAFTEIAPGIFLFPSIPIQYELDTNFSRLYKKQGGSFMEDKFTDELFMVLRKDEQINILTACSHRGITNICETAKNHFNLPVNLILGGFHMKDCSVDQYVHITHYLRNLHPKLLGTSHCTGVERFASLQTDCDSKVFYNATGNVVNL